MFTTLDFWAWVASALLALLYLWAGSMKISRPISALNEMRMEWATEANKPMVRFIGVAEIAGALGLILPIWTGILAWLTPLAALGLSLIQILAIGLHARRGETAKTLPLNLVLLVLSLFVLWARRGLLGL